MLAPDWQAIERNLHRQGSGVKEALTQVLLGPLTMGRPPSADFLAAEES